MLNIFVAVMSVLFVVVGPAPSAQAVTVTSDIEGTLVKGSLPEVYFVGSDNKRYVFPSERVFHSWYKDFSSVKTISDADLAALMIGGTVTYRPGTRLVKIQSDPKVYAVGAGGALRWISSEELARQLFGDNWAKQVDDVPVADFTSYKTSDPIQGPNDYNPSSELQTGSLIGGVSVPVDQTQVSTGGSVLDQGQTTPPIIEKPAPFKINSVEVMKMNVNGVPTEDSRSFKIIFSRPPTGARLTIVEQATGKVFYNEPIPATLVSSSVAYVFPGGENHKLLPSTAYAWKLVAYGAVNATGEQIDTATGEFTTSALPAAATALKIVSVSVDKVDALGHPAEDVRSFGIIFSGLAKGINLTITEKSSNAVFYSADMVNNTQLSQSVYLSPANWPSKLKPSTAYAWKITAYPANTAAGQATVPAIATGEFTTTDFSTTPPIAVKALKIISVSVDKVSVSGQLSEYARGFGLVMNMPAKTVSITIKEKTSGALFRTETYQIGNAETFYARPDNWTNQLKLSMEYIWTAVVTATTSTGVQTDTATGEFKTADVTINDTVPTPAFKIVSTSVDKVDALGHAAEDVRSFGINTNRPATAINIAITEKASGNLFNNDVIQIGGMATAVYVSPGNWKSKLKPSTTYAWKIVATEATATGEQTATATGEFTTTDFDLSTGGTISALKIVSVDVMKTDANGGAAEDVRSFKIVFNKPPANALLTISEKTTGNILYTQSIPSTFAPSSVAYILPSATNPKLKPSTTYIWKIVANANASTGEQTATATGEFTTKDFYSIQPIVITAFKILSTSVDKVDALGHAAEDVRSFGINTNRPATAINIAITEKASDTVFYTDTIKTGGTSSAIYVSPGNWQTKLKPSTTYTWKIVATEAAATGEQTATATGEFTTTDFATTSTGSGTATTGFQFCSVDNDNSLQGCCATGSSAFAPLSPTALTAGMLIRGTTSPVVYYYSANGKRYVMPNQDVMTSWYQFNTSTFAPTGGICSRVRQLADVDLAKITIGGNVAIRPGTYIVKNYSSQRSYVVARNRTLRILTNPDLAARIFPNDSVQRTTVLSDAFFGSYKIGQEVFSSTDYNPSAEYDWGSPNTMERELGN